MTLLVSEAFGPTVQGEGPLVGKPTLFLRLGGCSYRCSWCDSLHAVLPQHRQEWERMTAAQVMERLEALAPPPYLVTLSGGDPCQQNLSEVVRLGHHRGYTFAVETQGAIPAHWLDACDWVVVSPKPPSSGMHPVWTRLRKAMEVASPFFFPPHGRALKVPVFDAADLDWVERELLAREDRHRGWPVYLSVGNPHPPTDPYTERHATYGERWSGEGDRDLPRVLLSRYQWLSEEVLRRRLNATVTPQMHVLVWGNQRAR